jgi:YfiH family protein
MFSRHIGTSRPPFSSLNISYGVGDDPGNVAANRQRVKQALGTPFLLSAKQMHSDRIYCASDVTTDIEMDGYDALITNRPGVGLLIQQADCQAILMHDPNKQVIAAVHCGWRGSVANIIGLTIAEMQQRYQTNPALLLVAISPSLGPCCAEFTNYRQELPGDLYYFQERPCHFNFWDISIHQLVEAGVSIEHIDAARICTSCDLGYFSYRRSQKKEQLKTGRNGSAISLPLPENL